MLTENFIAATHTVNKQSAHISSALKDVGVFQYEFQPQSTFRHGFKKSSVYRNCLAISETHVYAAQADKAVINVYNREKGNHEATVPFPDRIHSLLYAEHAAILIIGTEDGKLVLWEVATGRLSNSAASHLQSVSELAMTQTQDLVVSGSDDHSIHVWSISRLVSFNRSDNIHSTEAPANSPVATFVNHRAAITTLGAGHSGTSTNIIVSSSVDNTCYVWHLQSQTILRTLLRPVNALCSTLDPADRCIYFGLEDGSIQHYDIYSSTSSSSSPYFLQMSTPIQLRAEDSWSPSSANAGSAQSITLSYDGTDLISGHTGGALTKWDVAKHRVVSELANVGQPITNLCMLTPNGLNRDRCVAIVPAVVKPRLELSIDADNSTVGLPPSYNLQIQIARSSSWKSGETCDDIDAALNGDAFSNNLLDDAVQAMLAKSAGVAGPTLQGNNNQDSKITGYKIEQLQEQLLQEKQRVKMFQDKMMEHEKRRQKRTQMRGKFLEKKIQAYRAAEASGKNGDAAMKLYHEVEDMIAAESDEDMLSPTPIEEKILAPHTVSDT